jgi:hypothetical protein
LPPVPTTMALLNPYTMGASAVCFLCALFICGLSFLM